MPADPRRSTRSAGGSGGSHLTIGKLIALLQPDFPDLAVSKVRFLEGEGLLDPERVGSGYRKYSDADVERLRYILTVQRDHFWPLKVIREALEARDRGEEAALPVAPPREMRLSVDRLAEAAGTSPELVEGLVGVGLIGPDGSGRFGPEDLQILESVVWLQEFGLEPRHLRSFRASADREIGLIEQMLAPSPAGRDRQVLAGQMGRRLLAIHAALVRKGLGGPP